MKGVELEGITEDVIIKRNKLQLFISLLKKIASFFILTGIVEEN